MLLPILAALEAGAAVTVTIAPRTIEPRTIAATLARAIITLPAGTSEFRPLVALALEFRPILARARERAVLAAATVVTLPPGLLVAEIARAAVAIPRVAVAIPVTGEIAALAARFEFRVLAAPSEAVIVAGSLEAAFVAIPEFPVLESACRTCLVPISTRGSVIPVATRRTLGMVEALGSPLVAVKAPRRLIAISTPERPLLAVAAKPRLVTAFAIEFLRRKAAFGKILLAIPSPAATFAPAGTVTPPARGIIVFVGVAGHERARLK